MPAAEFQKELRLDTEKHGLVERPSNSNFNIYIKFKSAFKSNIEFCSRFQN